MKKLFFFFAMTLLALASNKATAQKNNAVEVQAMLDRFLSYVKIESQSTYPDDTQSFQVNQGQKDIAEFIFAELNAINGLEVTMSPDYYIYAKLSSNSTRCRTTVAFMAHMDVTPECAGTGIRPQVIRNYKGGDIQLGTSGLVISPDSAQGRHLNDVVGKTIVTSNGTTNIGADDKTGCAVLVSMIEDLAKNKAIEHGDVYLVLSQNEDVGQAADRINLDYLDKTPDMLIDVDGGDVFRYSVGNFSAQGRKYLFKGNLKHVGDGKRNGFVDAATAAHYFIGALPPSVNPMFSEGRQGYLQAYIFDNLPNGDVRVSFRIRYFDRADSVFYASLFDNAEAKTLESFPGLEIVKEADYLQYDNVGNAMNPATIKVIESAAKRTEIPLEPEIIRAGTTGAMMVAKGLPGAPCLYSGQQAEHTVYEWCCIEELVEIKRLCIGIVEEVAKQ